MTFIMDDDVPSKAFSIILSEIRYLVDKKNVIQDKISVNNAGM